MLFESELQSAGATSIFLLFDKERNVKKMKYEKSCGAVIFDNDKILVIKQVKGHWGFPKGHVEEGETEVQTAIREIKEETNLDVKIDESKRFVERYSPEEGIEKDVVFFVAKKVGGEIKVQEEEVTETKWVAPIEAMEILTYESSKRILEKVLIVYLQLKCAINTCS